MIEYVIEDYFPPDITHKGLNGKSKESQENFRVF